MIENKERMQMDTQRDLKAKYDKMVKIEKAKKKRREEDEDDRKVLSEKRKEKFGIIQKRRDHLRDEFDKLLKDKELHYQKKMSSINDNHHRIASQEIFKNDHTPKSELGDSKLL